MNPPPSLPVILLPSTLASARRRCRAKRSASRAPVLGSKISVSRVPSGSFRIATAVPGRPERSRTRPTSSTPGMRATISNSAPRCLGVDTLAPDRVRLWLEDAGPLESGHGVREPG
jgi:hypothetical protein